MTRRTLDRVWSPQLRNRRAVDVYLPESYPSGLRYPVVYMHDGQNLSDPSIAFAGTWELDAALARLASRGREAIVVGIHNNEQRLTEYSPFPDRRHGGGGADRYLEFVATTLKPRIDRMFRTLQGRDETMIIGSSMGGLSEPVRVFPCSVGVRPRRRDEPVDLVRAGRGARLHRGGANAARADVC